MKKLITLEVENNPTMVMTIPVNQIIGCEINSYPINYHSGRLMGIYSGYVYLLKVKLYGSDDIKIPIKMKDYNRITKIMNKRYLTKQ